MNQSQIPISPETEEFASLQFRLRMATRSTGLTLRRAVALHGAASSKSAPGGTRVFEGFVPVPRAPETSSGILTEIGQKGFTVPARTGVEVWVGNFAQVAQSTDRVILVETVISKAYLAESAASSPEELPNGYDAMYVALKSADPVSTEDEESAGFTEHKYIVYRSSQLIPKYYLEFDIGEETEQSQLEQRKQRRVCEGCLAEPATIWCELEKIQLCAGCDGEVHKHPIMQRTHKRVGLREEHLKYGWEKVSCAVHCGASTTEDSTVAGGATYYCYTCKKVMCVECVVSGSHSSGGADRAHNLRPLQEVYNDIYMRTRTQQNEEAQTERYKTAVHKQTSKLEEEIEKVKERGAEVEKELRVQMERAIAAVHKIVDKKIRILKSDVAELDRQEEEVDWGYSYIQYASELMEPGEFIEMWKFYLEHNKRVTIQEVKTEVPIASGDIFIEGAVNISSPSMEVFECVGSPKRLANPKGSAMPPALKLPAPAVQTFVGPAMSAAVAAALGTPATRSREEPTPSEMGGTRSPRTQLTVSKTSSPRIFATKLKELEDNAKGNSPFTKCLPDWAARHNSYTSGNQNTSTHRANTFN